MSREHVSDESDLPPDPLTWTVDDVHRFARSAEPDDLDRIMRLLVSADDERAVAVIEAFLGANHDYVMLKPVSSQLATRALLSLGRPGVERLVDRLLDHNARFRYRSAALAAVWEASRGRGLRKTMSRDFGGLMDVPLPEGTVEAAQRAMRDVVAEALLDPETFELVASFLRERAALMDLPGTDHQLLPEAVDAGETAELMRLFAETSIRISRSLLDDFASLIARRTREEEYQQFLAAHPVLIDPLAASVIPKQRLGLEFATDFAVRSHDNRWLLVEIERPQDEIFTGGSDFRERFTHAFGQVLDFLHWVDDNVAYAQRQMIGITSPRGLVVIGQRMALTSHQEGKLRQFVENSRRIDVVTYDDLLARATSLYENLTQPR